VTAYVTTFYSFKGGVGRTTLLVNAAHVLAERGERVLVWDLDLEAPGVHQFPGLEPPERPWQSGFLEWLGNTPPCPTPEPTVAWPSEAWLNTLGDRVYAPLSKQLGKIFVLPAHGTFANLGRAYTAVDWHTLFVEHPEHGLHLFYRVRDALIARFEPTFLLVDSRTGISDLGGFLTGFLPDCTVLVGNYGVQSTEGLRSVYLALDRFAAERVQAEPHRQSKLDRLLVASPVPISPAALERGRERWSSGFPGVAPRSLIEIPLVENLLYAEDVLVRTAPSSDAARAYRTVAERLTELRASHIRSEPVDRSPGDDRTQLANIVQLLRLLGFVTAMSADDELVAHERTPLGERRDYRITYLTGAVRAHPAFRDVLDRLRGRPGQGQQLLIVDAAHEDARWAAEAAGITLRTVRELEDQLVDLRAYVGAVRRMFEDSELARTYVAPRVVTGGETSDALALGMSWAAGHGSRLLVVVGDEGSGKTSFVRRLAYELVTQIDVALATPVPVLIDLRHTTTTPTLASSLQQAMHTAIGWHGNPEALLHLYRTGRIVVLYDGLEKPFGPRGTEDLLHWFAWATTSPGPLPATHRMLVTVRANALYPPGAVAIDPPDVQIATLVPFDASQISAFLRYRLGAVVGDAALARIHGIPALARLASRPMLLQVLADGVGEIDARFEHATPAMLYERHVGRWIEREAPRSVLQPAQRAYVLERLAAELWRRRGSRLPGPSLLAALHDVIPSSVLTMSQLDLELRDAPFVTRSEADGYEFSHRSFLEYFVARHLARCIRAGADTLREELATMRLTPSCTARLVELVADAPGARNAIEAVVTGPYLADAMENAFQIAMALRASSDPIVQQFIGGQSSGPMETPGF
jgi:hypothetical protein